MPIITSLVNWLNIKRIYQIDLIRQYPFNVQQDTFEYLISKSKTTEWGVKYKYSAINDIESYQKSVPLQTYDDVKPFVERLRQGGVINFYGPVVVLRNGLDCFIKATIIENQNPRFPGKKIWITVYRFCNRPSYRIYFPGFTFLNLGCVF